MKASALQEKMGCMNLLSYFIFLVGQNEHGTVLSGRGDECREEASSSDPHLIAEPDLANPILRSYAVDTGCAITHPVRETRRWDRRERLAQAQAELLKQWIQ